MVPNTLNDYLLGSITGQTTNKLLKAFTLFCKRKKAYAEVQENSCNNWHVALNIKVLWFSTIANNTGIHSGVKKLFHLTLIPITTFTYNYLKLNNCNLISFLITSFSWSFCAIDIC